MNKKHSIVALVGETNSGKSTLINALVKDKVSITSHKVQTTRNRILGIYTEGKTQLVFIDTPGLFKKETGNDRFIMRFAYGSLVEADIIIVMLDCVKGITPVFEQLLKKLSELKNKNIVLVLNKVDLLLKGNREQLFELSDKLYKTKLFSEIFMISALKKDGLQDLLNYLLKREHKQAGWMFDGDVTSNVSLNFWAAEITREKIYKYIHQEVTYSTVVKPLQWLEDDNNIVIKQDIIVSKASHKKILVGAGGATIKTISMASRKEIQHYLTDKKVHLFLFVKVLPKATDKADYFNNLDCIDSTS